MVRYQGPGVNRQEPTPSALVGDLLSGQPGSRLSLRGG